MLELGMTVQEARAQGLTVPDHVPDCAVLTFDYSNEIGAAVADPHRINVNLTVRWEWVEVQIEP